MALAPVAQALMIPRNGLTHPRLPADAPKQVGNYTSCVYGVRPDDQNDRVNEAAYARGVADGLPSLMRSQ